MVYKWLYLWSLCNEKKKGELFSEKSTPGMQKCPKLKKYGCLYYSLVLSLSRMIKRTSPHSLSVLMMRWDELHLSVCGFSTNLDWGCFCCFSAGAGDCQQGSAPEAVGLEAGEVHSVLEGHPQCACGQHDLWLHLHPPSYRSDTNQMSNSNGSFPLSGTVRFGTGHPDLACYFLNWTTFSAENSLHEWFI